MNSFEVGDIGEKYVFDKLSNIYKKIKKVPDEIVMQLEYGDILLMGEKSLGIKNKKIEVKTELTDPNNNFFIERWSNKSTGRAGWLKTSKADELYYLYWEESYGFRFPCWQQMAWMIDYSSRDFRLVNQSKTKQDNDTWGYLVPQDYFARGPFMPIKFEIIQ